MKQSYSRIDASMVKDLKAAGIDPVQKLEVVKARILELESKSKGVVTGELQGLKAYSNCLNLESEVYAGRAVHMYMPGLEFCNWLVDCMSFMMPEHGLAIAEVLGDNVGVMHFPESSGLRTTMFGSVPHQADAQSVELYGATATGNKFMPYIILNAECNGEHTDQADAKYACRLLSVPCVNPTRSAYSSASSRYDYKEGDAQWYSKLLVAVGLYISCFPEIITAGMPLDLSGSEYHEFPDIRTVGIAPKIKQSMGGTHASPEAHYRKGHFRMLQNECFTHKRHKWVFVHGSFVGNARTVLTFEDADAAA